MDCTSENRWVTLVFHSCLCNFWKYHPLLSSANNFIILVLLMLVLVLCMQSWGTQVAFIHTLYLATCAHTHTHTCVNTHTHLCEHTLMHTCIHTIIIVTCDINIDQINACKYKINVMYLICLPITPFHRQPIPYDHLQYSVQGK